MYTDNTVLTLEIWAQVPRYDY